MTRCIPPTWALTLAFIALAVAPLAAAPIATGPDGVNTFTVTDLTYLVETNILTFVSAQGFVPSGNPATFTSTTSGNMALTNLLAPGTTVNSAFWT